MCGGSFTSELKKDETVRAVLENSRHRLVSVSSASQGALVVRRAQPLLSQRAQIDRPAPIVYHRQGRKKSRCDSLPRPSSRPLRRPSSGAPDHRYLRRRAMSRRCCRGQEFLAIESTKITEGSGDFLCVLCDLCGKTFSGLSGLGAHAAIQAAKTLHRLTVGITAGFIN